MEEQLAHIKNGKFVLLEETKTICRKNDTPSLDWEEQQIYKQLRRHCDMSQFHTNHDYLENMAILPICLFNPHHLSFVVFQL